VRRSVRFTRLRVAIPRGITFVRRFVPAHGSQAYFGSANLSVGTERGKIKAEETRDKQAPKFNAKVPNAGAHDEFEIWEFGFAGCLPLVS